MCCLIFFFSDRCLKYSVISLAVGLLAMSAVTIWQGIDAHQSPIWGMLSKEVGFDIQQYIYLMGIVAGCLLFLLSWMAFASAMLKVCSCYVPFGLLSFILAGALLSTGLLILQVGNDIKGDLTLYCKQDQSGILNQLLTDIDDQFRRLSDDIMCSSTCKCVEVSNELWDDRGYDISKNDFSGILTQVEECIEDFSVDQKAVSMVRDLEKTNKCNGICAPLKFRLFSDVKEGPFVKGCYEELEEYIQEKVINLGMIMLLTGSLAALGLFFHVGYYCRETEETQRKRTQRYLENFPRE